MACNLLHGCNLQVCQRLLTSSLQACLSTACDLYVAVASRYWLTHVIINHQTTNVQQVKHIMETVAASLVFKKETLSSTHPLQLLAASEANGLWRASQ